MSVCITLCQMKLFLLTTFLACLVGCSTATNRAKLPARARPVLFTYHVKPGAEKALEAVLKQAWTIYRREGVVIEQPHLCVLFKEDDQNSCIMEMFALAGPFAIEYQSEAVKRIWEQIASFCEGRRGERGVEYIDAKVLMR